MNVRFEIFTSAVAAMASWVAAISAAGHEIGNHLMRDEPSVRLPEQRFARDQLAHARQRRGHVHRHLAHDVDPHLRRVAQQPWAEPLAWEGSPPLLVLPVSHE